MIANEQSLDRVSRDVLAFIRKERPKLVPHTTAVAGADGSYVLEVSVPSPNPKLSYPLFVSTENEEITWGFGSWHGHADADTEEQIGEVFAQIDQVFEDKLLAVAYSLDGKWAGGTLVKSREAVLVGLFESFSGSVEIRSWTGSRDEDLQAPNQPPQPTPLKRRG